MAAPIANVSGRGWLNQKKSAAQTNPSGTRQRCLHVPGLANRHQFARSRAVVKSESIRDRVHNPLDVDVHADPFRT